MSFTEATDPNLDPADDWSILAAERAEVFNEEHCRSNEDEEYSDVDVELAGVGSDSPAQQH